MLPNYFKTVWTNFRLSEFLNLMIGSVVGFLGWPTKDGTKVYITKLKQIYIKNYFIVIKN